MDSGPILPSCGNEIFPETYSNESPRVEDNQVFNGNYCPSSVQQIENDEEFSETATRQPCPLAVKPSSVRSGSLPREALHDVWFSDFRFANESDSLNYCRNSDGSRNINCNTDVNNSIRQSLKPISDEYHSLQLCQYSSGCLPSFRRQDTSFSDNSLLDGNRMTSLNRSAYMGRNQFNFVNANRNEIFSSSSNTERQYRNNRYKIEANDGYRIPVVNCACEEELENNCSLMQQPNSYVRNTLSRRHSESYKPTSRHFSDVSVIQNIGMPPPYPAPSYRQRVYTAYTPSCKNGQEWNRAVPLSDDEVMCLRPRSWQDSDYREAYLEAVDPKGSSFKVSMNDSMLSRPLPPGENNPNAVPGGKLCFEYMNKGRCHRMELGHVCRFRHLVATHPDAIADRFRSGLLAEIEIEKYCLRECEPYETNPFAPKDAKICYEYLNNKICSRTYDMKICRYRHLLPDHPDAINNRRKTLACRTRDNSLESL